MNPSNFDELTKALASSTSRRHALRVIVTTAVGGLLGLTSVSTAFGRHQHRTKRTNKPSGPPPGNSNCAAWCAQVFGPNTSAAGQCTKDAAHGGGLCATCGSNTPPTSICCKRLTNGYCSGTSAARCPCNSNNCETCDTSHGTCSGCSGSTPNCCGSTCAECCEDSDCTGTNETCQSGQCGCVTPPLPDRGPNLFDCNCNDGSHPFFCLSSSCNDIAQFCNDRCLCHGGVAAVGGARCAPDATIC